MSEPTIDFLNEDDEFNLFRKNIEIVLTSMAEKLEERLQQMDKSIESIEQQIATMVVGYGEQAVFMEALIGQINFAAPEAQKVFTDTLARSRREMLKVMKEGADGFLVGDDENLSTAIKDLVDEKLLNDEQQ
ncbi:hypothetical protein UFOVP784_231 [uncultured Caudovirales phage]|jgi:hypothetical protein|uniref:Uncharacterized protein n=1 Tax=uncultured Caudovirales phage TaxID=2100421 RepID=A0A6J5P1A9_9CAUD|nr:hypothetical protein UFOVP436_231 [uncultured Caudovirales phage]CAB4163015.1 hypothetical protein UFOVP784_231 [uncultured Caudovirales phage]